MEAMLLVHAVLLLLTMVAPLPGDASLLHHTTHLHRDHSGQAGHRGIPTVHSLLRGLLEVCPEHMTLSDCMEQEGLDDEAAAATMHLEQQQQQQDHASEQNHDACSLHAVLTGAASAAGLNEADDARDDEPDSPETVSARILIALLLLATLLTLGLAYYRIDSAPSWLSRRMVKALNVEGLAGQHLAGSDVGLSKLLTYLLDKHLSSTPSFKIQILAIVTAALIVFGGLALFAAGEDSLYSAFWLAVAGAGLDWTFSDKAHGENWAALIMRAVSLLLSIGGMLVTALLLGLVSDAISSKVDDLRKGKTAVLESDHTLIIGFSEKVFCLIQELALGKASVGGRPIVILAEKDKEAMEDAIGAHNIEMHGSSISCRTGDPLMRSELLKVSAQFASSIIILANDSHPQQSDASLIRVVLSLMVIHMELHSCGRGGLKGHIVAEACNRDHRDLLLHLGYAQLLHTVVPHDLSARMMVQCARHPQVLTALTELTGFAGSEFHVDPLPPSKLEGLPFHQLQKLYPSAVPVGVKKANGEVLLRPSANEMFQKGDSMILIAGDESSLQPDASKLNAAAAQLYVSSHGSSPDDDLNLCDDSSAKLLGAQGQTLNSFLMGRQRAPPMLAGAGRPVPGGESFSVGAAAPPASLHGRLREIAGRARANLAVGEPSAPTPRTQPLGLATAASALVRRNRTEQLEDNLRGQMELESQELPWWDRVPIAPGPPQHLGAEFPNLERHSAWTQSGVETESVVDGSAMQHSSVSASHFGGRFLVCGWRRDMAGLIRVFDEICTFKSELWLFSSVSVEVRSKLLEQGGLILDDKGLNHELKQLRVVFKERQLEGNLVSKWHMKLLDPLQFRAVLILADDPASANLASMGSQIKGLLTAVLAANSSSFDTSTPMTAVDSQSLTTLLLLRQTQLEQLHDEHEAEARREAKLPKSASLPDKLPLLQQQRTMRRSAQQPSVLRQTYKPPRSPPAAPPPPPLSTSHSGRGDQSLSPPRPPGRPAGDEDPNRSLLDDATAAAVQSLLGEEASDLSMGEVAAAEPSFFNDATKPDARAPRLQATSRPPDAELSVLDMSSSTSAHTAVHPSVPSLQPPLHVWSNGGHRDSSCPPTPTLAAPPSPELRSPGRNGPTGGLGGSFIGSPGLNQQGTRTYTSPVFDTDDAEERTDTESDGSAAGVAARSPLKPMAAAVSAASACRSPTRARTSQSFLEQWRQRVLCSDDIVQPPSAPASLARAAAGPAASTSPARAGPPPAGAGPPGGEAQGGEVQALAPRAGPEHATANGNHAQERWSVEAQDQPISWDSLGPPPLARDKMARQGGAVDASGPGEGLGLSPPASTARPGSLSREPAAKALLAGHAKGQPPLLSAEGVLEQFRMLPTAPWDSSVWPRGGGPVPRYPEEDEGPAGVGRLPQAVSPDRVRGTTSSGRGMELQGDGPVESPRALDRGGMGSASWAGERGWDPDGGVDRGQVDGGADGEGQSVPGAWAAAASSGRGAAGASAMQLGQGALQDPGHHSGSGRWNGANGNMGDGSRSSGERGAAPLVKVPSHRDREVKRQSSQHHEVGGGGGGGGMALFSAFTDAHLESVVEGQSDDCSSCDGEGDGDADGESCDSSCDSGAPDDLEDTEQEQEPAAAVECEGTQAAGGAAAALGDEPPAVDLPPLMSGVSMASMDRSFSRGQAQSQRHPSSSRPTRHSHSHSHAHSHHSHAHHSRRHLVSNQWPKELRQVVKQSTIVTEMLDSKSLALVKEMHISKYIMSNDMTAQLLALISCCPERAEIYHELLWPGGTSLSVRPVGTLLSKIERISFYEASERLMNATGDILVGYIEQLGQKTTINPADKAANVISCATTEALITLVRGNDENDSA